jgi:hypothetical protein
VVKTMGAEATFASAADATQVMGGDGVNRFYPIQNIFEVAKTDFIAGGTLEACRLTVFRAGLRLMSEDMKMPRRVISEKLGVPIPTADPVEQKVALSEESLLKVLGEDYRINQGLHMTIEDIQQYIDADAADIAKVIDALQEQNLVMTYRNRKGEVQLVKANYRGLNKAYPKEYYRWAPDYVTEDRKF